MRLLLWSLCSAFVYPAILLLAPAAAKAVVLEATIEAGSHDRSGVPVCLVVEIPEEFADLTHVALSGTKGTVAPIAQLTGLGMRSMSSTSAEPKLTHVDRELHFLITDLKAGQSVTIPVNLSAKAKSLPAEQTFSWGEHNGKNVQLKRGDKPILQYEYEAIDTSSRTRREATFKPFHHLYDPLGKHLLTKGPGGQFTHHRGLFFGFNRITYDGNKKADVWHAAGDAHQSHQGFVDQEAGPLLGRHCVEIDWHGEQGTVFARETREVTVYNTSFEPGRPDYLVEFASFVFSPGGSPVRLDGDPQHAGFHFRAAQDVAESTKEQTYYIRPSGVGKPGSTINWDPKKGDDNPPETVDQPWKGMSFVTSGDRYTAAYLDKPTNPKPARFSERDYGRFGSYFEFTITEDKPLHVDYRLGIEHGEMTQEEIQRLSTDFVEPPVVDVSVR